MVPESRLHAIFQELVGAPVDEFLPPRSLTTRRDEQPLPPERFYAPVDGRRGGLPGLDDPIRIFDRDGKVFLVMALVEGGQVIGYGLRSARLPSLGPNSGREPSLPGQLAEPPKAAIAPPPPAKPARPAAWARTALLTTIPLLLLIGGWMIGTGVFEASTTATEVPAKDPLVSLNAGLAEVRKTSRGEIDELKRQLQEAVTKIGELQEHQKGLDSRVEALVTRLTGFANKDDLNKLASKASLNELQEIVGPRPDSLKKWKPSLWEYASSQGETITYLNKRTGDLEQVNANWNKTHDEVKMSYYDSSNTLRTAQVVVVTKPD